MRRYFPLYHIYGVTGSGLTLYIDLSCLILAFKLTHLIIRHAMELMINDQSHE